MLNSRQISCAVLERFGENSADEAAFLWEFQPEDMRGRHTDIGITGRRWIHKPQAKTRTDGSHEVTRVGPAKATVHALPLLQRVVRNCYAAHQRLAATRRKGTKVDDDRGQRSYCGTFEIDRAQRQSSRYAAERVVDKQAADVILSEQHVDNLANQFFGVWFG